MAKYFLYADFLTYTKQDRFLGFRVGEEKIVNELVSISIVGDGVQYYAVSKDFNLKEAWKHKFINDVLKSIYEDFFRRLFSIRHNVEGHTLGGSILINNEFSYSDTKKLIGIFGRYEKEILKAMEDVLSKQDIELHICTSTYNACLIKDFLLNIKDTLDKHNVSFVYKLVPDRLRANNKTGLERYLMRI